MGERIINPARTLMLGIDLQRAFGDAVPVPQAPEAVANAIRALNAWRPVGRIVLTCHVYKDRAQVGRLDDFLPGVYDVLREGSPLAELYDGVKHDDPVMQKTRFNALIGTELDRILRTTGIRKVIVFGLTTPICVQTTVDALMMSDRRVVLLEDACASQAMGQVSPEDAHYNAVQRMGSLFAEVISTDTFIDQLG